MDKNIDSKDEEALLYFFDHCGVDGNEKGLKKLIKACEEALENGKSKDFIIDEVEYEVTKVGSDYSNAGKVIEASSWQGITIVSVLLILLISMVVGFVTIVKYLFF